MDRRSFLKLMGSTSLLTLPPTRSLLSLTEKALHSSDANQANQWTPEQLGYLRKIRFFEAQLQQMGGKFSWYLHNELRHYWGAFSEAKSLYHADIILENSVMDDYILNTLSDWHNTTEEGPRRPDLAIKSLRRRAESYPELFYVNAACWLRAGEISQAITLTNQAHSYYQKVIRLESKAGRKASSLGFYRGIAQARLTV